MRRPEHPCAICDKRTVPPGLRGIPVGFRGASVDICERCVMALTLGLRVGSEVRA